MKYLVALVLLALMGSLLVACPGNPFGGGGFTDQFRHELKFSRGGGTEPASTVLEDERDLVMFQIQAKVDSPSEPIRIDTIDFRATGTGDDLIDVAAVRLYLDGDRDGLVSTGDVQIGGTTQFTADNGKVRFSRLNLVIDDGDSATLILAYDLAGTASSGEIFGVRLADESDVDSEGDDSGCPVDIDGIPVVSPDRTVDDGAPTSSELLVNLGLMTPPARTVGTAAKGVEMVQIAVETTGPGDATLESITFQGSGTANEVDDISAVYLYRDVDADGMLDLGQDVLVSVSAYDMDDGRVVFPGVAEGVPAGIVTYLLVVYDLAGSGWIDETLRAGILDGFDVVATDVASGAQIPVIGLPLDGEVVTIKFGE